MQLTRNDVRRTVHGQFGEPQKSTSLSASVARCGRCGATLRVPTTFAPDDDRKMRTSVLAPQREASNVNIVRRKQRGYVAARRTLRALRAFRTRESRQLAIGTVQVGVLGACLSGQSGVGAELAREPDAAWLRSGAEAPRSSPIRRAARRPHSCAPLFATRNVATGAPRGFGTRALAAQVTRNDVSPTDNGSSYERRSLMSSLSQLVSSFLSRRPRLRNRRASCLKSRSTRSKHSASSRACVTTLRINSATTNPAMPLETIQPSACTNITSATIIHKTVITVSLEMFSFLVLEF